MCRRASGIGDFVSPSAAKTYFVRLGAPQFFVLFMLFLDPVLGLSFGIHLAQLGVPGRLVWGAMTLLAHAFRSLWDAFGSFLSLWIGTSSPLRRRMELKGLKTDAQMTTME